MVDIKKILVPTDFSPIAANAFQYAVWFAQKYNAAIQLLNIVYPATESIELPSMAAQITQDRVHLSKQQLETFIEENLAIVKQKHELPVLPVVTSDLDIGYPVSLISTYAKREHFDLIIMGTKGAHNAVEQTFGSVTTATIAKSDCPVLAIPEEIDTQKIQSVAYATDLSEGTPLHIWEASKLLHPFAPSFRVVHVQSKEAVERSLDIAKLEHFFEDHSTLDIRCYNLKNEDVLEELDEFVENRVIDLLIMYKPKRSIFDRIFHRSITRKMALNTKVPLLVLR